MLTFVATTENELAEKVNRPVMCTVVPVVNPAQVTPVPNVVALFTVPGTPSTVMTTMGHVPVTPLMLAVPSTTRPSASAQPCCAAHAATAPSS